MTLVKICGIRDAATAIAAAEAGADFIGLVFAQSRRQVTPQACHDIVEAIAERRRSAPPFTFDGPSIGEVSARSWFPAWADAIELALARARPLIVGVFAGMTADEVNDLADAACLDLVQLSGGEDNSVARAIERPVIRAVHVHDGQDTADITERIIPGLAAATLLDTGGHGAYGGTGVPFDWRLAADVAERFPVMLAGGLTPANIAEAIREVRPWAVDVSSGVETDGAKDVEKIRAFIRAAKGASRDR